MFSIFENGKTFSRRTLSALLVACFLFGNPLMTKHALAEEEGGGGGKAAEILFGLAAIIAAASPMVAASIQANADKSIAKTNAKAQITMTNISANTSRALAENQKEIALTQAQIAQQVNAENQASVTRRLENQLSELRAARQEANAIDERKMQYQQQLDRERIEFARQQADETVRAASQQARLQLAAAGMSQGFSRTQNSGAGLTTNRPIGGGGTVAGTGYGPVATGGYGPVVNNPMAAQTLSLGVNKKVSSSVESAAGGKTRLGVTSRPTTSRGLSETGTEAIAGGANLLETRTIPISYPTPPSPAGMGTEADETAMLAQFETTVVEGKKRPAKGRPAPKRGVASVANPAVR